MKTSEVLRRVRNHLGDGGYMFSHERYGCYAADYLYRVAEIGDRDRTKVKKVLGNHLGGRMSLEVWLLEHHRIQVVDTPRYKKKIMTTRKAWLTHLIEHYEAKGD